MAHNTFLRDWVVRGERDVSEIARYLQEVKTRYGAFSSFFVSERTSIYYTGEGVLKKMSPSEPRDVWYYRVRDMKEPYEINVDPDMANKDTMTIYINFRVVDFAGQYLGAAGVGLSIDAVHSLIRDYQQRYRRAIYFVNAKGQAVLQGGQAQPHPVDLYTRAGLREILERILREKNGDYQYENSGGNYLLNVHYVPELRWYLFVEKDEFEALAEIRKTLYINLAVCLLITLVVVMLAHLTLKRYQEGIEDMASLDKLTGLFNRQAFAILMDKLQADHQREPRPLSVLMVDVDHFKSINDRYGHAVGDQVLARVSELLRTGLRKSDIAVRWGGEEFLLVLRNCDLTEARQIADKLRRLIEQEAFELAGQRVSLTISVGVSQLDRGELSEQAIHRADVALYRAKNSGRNRIEVESPDRTDGVTA